MNYKSLPYRIYFKKISVNHQKIRSDEILGYTENFPKIDSQFVMFSDPIDKNTDVRIINTSIVKEFLSKTKDFIVFKTESGSVYEVRILAN